MKNQNIEAQFYEKCRDRFCYERDFRTIERS